MVATKVGNVLGRQMSHADGVVDMAKINDSRLNSSRGWHWRGSEGVQGWTGF